MADVLFQYPLRANGLSDDGSEVMQGIEEVFQYPLRANGLSDAVRAELAVIGWSISVPSTGQRAERQVHKCPLSIIA